MPSAAARHRLTAALLRPALPGRSGCSDEPFVETAHVLPEHRLDEVIASASEPDDETALLQRGQCTQDLRSRHGTAFRVGRVEHRLVSGPFCDLLQVLVLAE